jgi:hypothetical protein
MSKELISLTTDVQGMIPTILKADGCSNRAMVFSRESSGSLDGG